MMQDVVIDYAYPMMMAEKAMKEAHNHMLDTDYDKAIEQMLVAMTEAKMTLNSIKHMKEQRNALREQAEAVQKGV
jgi:hypothetical protein